jgi:RNA polymerase sigma-70 factor (ECF subfamily)
MTQTLQELSDGMLLEECKRNNAKAYDVLFDRYSARLYHYALQYIREETVAEETMMDLMVWIWEKRHQLDPDIRLAPYLFRAMKNAVIKVITRKSRATLPLDEKFENISSSAPYEADYLLRCNELQETYEEKLAELSRQRQRVFSLSRHENMSHAEIAKETRLSVFTVKNHIKASLSHFRLHLKDHVDTLVILVVWLLHS